MRGWAEVGDVAAHRVLLGGRSAHVDESVFGNRISRAEKRRQVSHASVRVGVESRSPIPLFLAGFSFGGAVMLRVQQAFESSDAQPVHCALVAPAMWQRFGGETPPSVPLTSLVIHGDKDDTVALTEVMTWAQPQGLPVTVIPDGEHFFHGRLGVLKDITSNWCRGRLHS